MVFCLCGWWQFNFYLVCWNNRRAFLNRPLIVDGLDYFGNLDPIILAVVALSTPGMTSKDIFTLHSPQGASTWRPFCRIGFRLRLRLCFSQNWIHNQSSQPCTIDDSFKFILGACYVHLCKSALLKLLSKTRHCLRYLLRLEFDLIFLYLCDSFLDRLVFIEIWRDVRIFIIDNRNCLNWTIRILLEIQKRIFVLPFKDSQIFLIFN